MIKKFKNFLDRYTDQIFWTMMALWLIGIFVLPANFQSNLPVIIIVILGLMVLVKGF